MNKRQLKPICGEILDIFHGLMDGYIEYTPDKLDCAMGRSVEEVFDGVVGTFYMNVDNGHSISKDELQELRDNLTSFNETYDVSEVTELIKHIDELLK